MIPTVVSAEQLAFCQFCSGFNIRDEKFKIGARANGADAFILFNGRYVFLGL